MDSVYIKSSRICADAGKSDTFRSDFLSGCVQHVRTNPTVPTFVQAESDKTRNFSDRLKRLKAIGSFKSDTALAKFIGLSRGHMSEQREGHEPVSDKSLDKLSEAEAKMSEILRASAGGIIHEPPAKYGNTARVFHKQEEDPSSLKLNSAFRPPAAELTAPQCVRHVTEYLSEVSQVPGAVGRVWTQLQLHLPLSEARLLREQHERSYPELYEHE